MTIVENKSYKYMIGSGWRCNDSSELLSHHNGDSKIRSSDFHHIWHRLINRFSSPSRILIVDSASPIAPPVDVSDERIVVHKLAVNAGHATNCESKFCGWAASVLVGLLDCLHSDNDYFVYI